ncbi:MAG: WD40 repeat domain-containing protein [Planctomycetota bacterium]
MSPTESRDALTVFREVYAKALAERTAALEQLCGADPAVRAEVEELLRHHDEPAAVLAISDVERRPPTLPVPGAAATGDTAALRPRRRLWLTAAALLLPVLALAGLALAAVALRDRTATIRPGRVARAREAAVAFAADGQALAAWAEGNTVRIVEVARDVVRCVLVAPSTVRAPAFAPEADRLAAWSGDHDQHADLLVWNARTGALLHRVPHLPGAAAPLRVPRHANTVHWTSGEADHHYDLSHREHHVTARVPAPWATSASGRWQLRAAADGGGRLVAPDGATRRLRPTGAGLRAASFSANEQWLATASTDGGVRLWPLRGGPPRPIPGPARGLALDAQGRRLLVLREDRAEIIDLDQR